jgi:hypothetical protein
MSLHTIGDSHSHHGFENIQKMRHNLGPLLCYNFPNRFNIKDYPDIKEGDTVIFCLGEIDCRCHVAKHINNERDYKSVISDIVNNYMIAIKENTTGLRVGVYNVVPPVRKTDTWNNESYPFLGTDEDRKSYVLYFNQMLRERCKEYNFLFVDIYNKYVDKDGYLDRKLSDGTVHIGQGKFLEEFLIEHKFLQ